MELAWIADQSNELRKFIRRGKVFIACNIIGAFALYGYELIRIFLQPDFPYEQYIVQVLLLGFIFLSMLLFSFQMFRIVRRSSVLLKMPTSARVAGWVGNWVLLYGLMCCQLLAILSFSFLTQMMK